jgi:hypothetical protein
LKRTIRCGDGELAAVTSQSPLAAAQQALLLVLHVALHPFVMMLMLIRFSSTYVMLHNIWLQASGFVQVVGAAWVHACLDQQRRVGVSAALLCVAVSFIVQ